MGFETHMFEHGANPYTTYVIFPRFQDQDQKYPCECFIDLLDSQYEGRCLKVRRPF